MIIKKTTKEVKEVVTNETFTQCDLCKVVVPSCYMPNWADGKKSGTYHDREYSEIKYSEGQVYSGEDTCMTTHETHVCVDCFKSKVRPALEALGCVFHESDD